MSSPPSTDERLVCKRVGQRSQSARAASTAGVTPLEGFLSTIFAQNGNHSKSKSAPLGGEATTTGKDGEKAGARPPKTLPNLELARDKRRNRKQDDALSLNSSTHTATTCSTMTNSLNSPVPRGGSSLSSHSSLLASNPRKTLASGPAMLTSPLENHVLEEPKQQPAKKEKKSTPRKAASFSGPPIYSTRKRSTPGAPARVDSKDHDISQLASNEERPTLLCSSSKHRPTPADSSLAACASTSSSSASSSAGSMTFVTRKTIQRNSSSGTMPETGPKRRSARSSMSLSDYRQLSHSFHSSSSGSSNSNGSKNHEDKKPSAHVAVSTEGGAKRSSPPPPPPPYFQPNETSNSSGNSGEFKRDQRKSLRKVNTGHTPRASNRKGLDMDVKKKRPAASSKPKDTLATVPDSETSSSETQSPHTPVRQKSSSFPIISPAYHIRGGMVGQRNRPEQASSSSTGCFSSPNGRMQDMAASMERLSFAAYRESYRTNASCAATVSSNSSSHHGAGITTILGSTNHSINPNSTSTHATIRSILSQDNTTTNNNNINNSSFNNSSSFNNNGTSHSRLSLASYRESAGRIDLPLSSPSRSPILSAPSSSQTLGTYSDSSRTTDNYNMDSDPEDTSICSESDSDSPGDFGED